MKRENEHRERWSRAVVGVKQAFPHTHPSPHYLLKKERVISNESLKRVYDIIPP
jgi:hypothetical protein